MAALVGCFGIIIFAVVIGGFNAWLLMLAIGVLHSYVPEVPAIGFLPAWLVLVVLGILFGRSGVTVQGRR